jgi:hypothetical protein
VKLHGASPWHPRGGQLLFVAANVKLHGASPWHPRGGQLLFVAASVRLHGASPVASRTFYSLCRGWILQVQPTKSRWGISRTQLRGLFKCKLQDVQSLQRVPNPRNRSNPAIDEVREAREVGEISARLYCHTDLNSSTEGVATNIATSRERCPVASDWRHLRKDIFRRFPLTMKINHFPGTNINANRRKTLSSFAKRGLCAVRRH